MQSLQSKHFSILDKKGVNTVIYQVNKSKKASPNNAKYTVEKLDFLEEIKGDNVQRTFFIDEPKKFGNSLVLFSFEKDKVMVNSGILINDEVKITKQPKSYHYQTIMTSEDNLEKEINYTPNLKRSITIIDPENGEEVTPILYWDEKTNDVKGKCKMKPNKSYFAFEIKEN